MIGDQNRHGSAVQVGPPALVPKIGQHDQVHDFDGVKVIVDAKSAIYLQGTQLDFQKDLMGGNFKFVNPNADKTCGCGESFSA